MIFYFTGTGNSLYAAKKIEDNPISIPQVMRNEDLHFTADTIGIVTPMVKEFLHKATFHTDYFYLILTYGNRHGGTAELAKQLCDNCTGYGCRSCGSSGVFKPYPSDARPVLPVSMPARKRPSGLLCPKRTRTPAAKTRALRRIIKCKGANLL